MLQIYLLVKIVCAQVLAAFAQKIKHMKTLLYFFGLILIISSCKTINHKTKNKTISDISEIVNSIKKKDIASVKKMVNSTNVNEFDSNGVNLLTHAVMAEDFDLVKILIEKGANPNLKNKTKTGSTPLMMSSGAKSTKIAEYLIKNNADVDIPDKNGDPAINWSAYYGNIPFTKLMLENKAKTNQKSIHSDGVMQVALKEYKDSIVDLFINNNISIHNVKPANKAIIKAVKQGNFKLFKSLANKSNQDTRDEAGNTLLIIATNKKSLPIVKFLVNNGAKINAMNPVGMTALNKAIFYGHNEIANFLISNGADINLTGKRFSLCPMVAAIRGNNLDMGKTLLEKNANINIADGINNFSPIMWATMYGNKEFVSLLLKYKPDLNIISKYKSTVFGMTNDKEILKLLNNSKN